MRTPATTNLIPELTVRMRSLAQKAQSGHCKPVGTALMIALNMLENVDTKLTRQVNALQVELDALEAKNAGPYQHLFFTCPEPGRDSNGIIEIFENCVLKRDFGRFLRGTTISQIILNYAEGAIRLYDGHGMVEFKVKVELIQQG